MREPDKRIKKVILQIEFSKSAMHKSWSLKLFNMPIFRHRTDGPAMFSQDLRTGEVYESFWLKGQCRPKSNWELFVKLDGN